MRLPRVRLSLFRLQLTDDSPYFFKLDLPLNMAVVWRTLLAIKAASFRTA